MFKGFKAGLGYQFFISTPFVTPNALEKYPFNAMRGDLSHDL